MSRAVGDWRQGIERIVDIQLNGSERAMFDKSCRLWPRWSTLQVDRAQPSGTSSSQVATTRRRTASKPRAR